MSSDPKAIDSSPRIDSSPHEDPPPPRSGTALRDLVLAALSLYLLLLAPVYGDNENRSHALLDAFYSRRSVTIDVHRFPTCDLALDHGEPRSGGAPGVAFVGFLGYAPVRFFASRLSSGDGDPAGYLAAIVVASVVPAALGAWALARLGARLGDRLGTPGSGAAAPEAALIFAFGTLALAYAPRFMAQALVMGSLSVALLAVSRALESERTTRAAISAAMAGAAAAIATAADYPAALALLALGALLVLAPGPRAQRGAGYALGAALPLGALLAYHAAAFGHPLHTPYQSHSDQGTRLLLAQGVMGYERPTLATLAEVALGARAGLVPHVPAVVPGALGLVLALRSTDARIRAQGLTCLLLAAAYFLLNAGRLQDWWGGASVGPRYLLVALPMALAFLPEGLASLSPGARRGFVVASIAVAWLEAQASLHFWPESTGFLGRLADVVRTGPQLGWVRLLSWSTGVPSTALVPLVSAVLIWAWGLSVARIFWRRDRALARVGLGIALATLAHLALMSLFF